MLCHSVVVRIIFKRMNCPTSHWFGGSHSKAGGHCVWHTQQALSGRMSARMAAIEQTQAEFRQQLSDILLTSQNNEQALKANS